MTGRKATVMAEFFSALVALVSPEAKEAATQVKADPAMTARIRKYMALTMVERYGAHGPP